jgi:hypothetical protein
MINPLVIDRHAGSTGGQLMQPKDTSSSTKPARLTGEISNSIVLLLSNIVHIGPKNRQIPHYSRVFGVVFSLNTNANKVIWKFNKLAIHR